MAAEVDIKALRKASVHFGQTTSRQQPKTVSYTHSKRQDAYMIDLTNFTRRYSR